MNCPSCGSSPRIASSKLDSPVGTSDIFSVMVMVCVNPDCMKYESNLKSPSQIIEVIRNKVN